MDRLYEISICSNKTTFLGRILVNEDGWFEGIAQNTAYEFQKEKLLFGSYVSDQKISLFLLHSKGQIKYEAKKTTKGYKGKILILEVLGEIPYGECQIYLCPSEQIREPLNHEEELLNQWTKKNLELRTKKDIELYQRICTAHQKQATQLSTSKRKKEQTLCLRNRKPKIR